MSDPAAKRRWPHWSLRTMFVLVFLVGCIVALLLPVASVFEYARHQEIGGNLIASLEQRRPSNVSPAEWENSTTWIGIAFANVCYSPNHVAKIELKHFNDDVRSKLDGNVDLETIDWIWNRLADTGPHGAQYVAKFEPIYHSEFANIQSPSTP